MKDRYISFDWAMKRMLRDKANFAVLEGLLTVLLEEKIVIKEILESEGNQESEKDKYNRVDIKVENSKGEIVIVEIQNARERFFLERILYGVSKAITEHISLGNSYEKVRKVISISILYFNWGKGDDYLYHGQTDIKGVHSGSKLAVSQRDRDAIIVKYPDDILPEYYFILVNSFQGEPKTPMEQWVNYLKTGEINDDANAPGLAEARQRLLYYNMSKAERLAFDRHIDNLMVEYDVFGTARMDGHAEGLAQGLAKGLAQGRSEATLSIAKKMKEQNVQSDVIAAATGLSKEEIDLL